ncbi:MAG: membrane dipeptidase, partial [Planctomycetes bacterium]|nr:membrane dipeptidase [Planctomycetota bacterium]
EIARSGRIACMMGIEGGHIIEDSLFALRMFHRLGCRYMTLTHSFNTNWADAAGIDDDTDGEHNGLTEFGRDIIREMNRLGMMVDISHVADKTFYDALEVSTAPPIASHSSARAINSHRRNLSDDMLRALAAKDGAIMINFYCGFIDPEYDARYKAWESKHQEALAAIGEKFKANLAARRDARAEFAAQNPPPRSSLLTLAKHVEHVAKTIGWRHVGIGADWDGIRSLPEGIDHCGDLPKLTALLLARGATPEQLRGFLGENLIRVLEACEQRARNIAAGN